MNKTTTDTSVEEGQADAAKRREIGEFVRGVSGFRNVLGSFEFLSEAGRNHLFVALNCPWCHRVTLARNLLGLQSSISLEVAFSSRTDEDDPVGPNLWGFNPTRITTLTGTSLPECMPETATGAGHRLVKQIYAAQGSGEGSVPVLYDKKTKRIVNNESAEIIRTLNDQADALGSSISTADRPNLYPDDHIVRDEINALNEAIYVSINNGAHKTGFSSDQTVYAAAFKTYFDMLGAIEARLASDDRLFIAGDKFTEADLRLFPTLYRHDPVYYVRMKLNGARILDYPHLWRWLCRVYALPDVAASSSLIHCRQGYFGRSWNNVIPLGPIKPTTYPEAYKHSE